MTKLRLMLVRFPLGKICNDETIAVVDQSCSSWTTMLFVSTTNIIDVDGRISPKQGCMSPRFAVVTMRSWGTPVIDMCSIAKLFPEQTAKQARLLSVLSLHFPRYDYNKLVDSPIDSDPLLIRLLLSRFPFVSIIFFNDYQRKCLLYWFDTNR